LCRADAGLERAPTVVVSWAGTPSGSSPESREIELTAGAGAGVSMDSPAIWICRAGPGERWVDSLVDANCTEVLLTARVSESDIGRQLVLELAGLLTRRLGRNNPAIRVRFVSNSGRPHRSPRR
jgi:hypothetical protein